MDGKAQEALVVGPQVGAEAKDGNILHTHTLFQSELGHTGAGIRTANAGVGSILQVVYSLLGCIPRKVGISGLAAVGTHCW